MRIARRSLRVTGNILLLLICLLAPAIQHTAQEKVRKGSPRVGQKAPVSFAKTLICFVVSSLSVLFGFAFRHNSGPCFARGVGDNSFNRSRFACAWSAPFRWIPGAASTVVQRTSYNQYEQDPVQLDV